ncbi:hypothetical protein DL771_009948 [Monosporascus sp. 5C6A]|nr:hypothetical protein DL771_009948 [Monosporascus sp. 5C6A]
MPYLNRAEAPDSIPDAELIETLLNQRNTFNHRTKRIRKLNELTQEQRSRTGLLTLGKREEVIQGDPYALYPYWAGNVGYPRDPRMFDIMKPIMYQLKSKIMKKTKETERAEIRRRAAVENDDIATWLATVKNNWQANWTGDSRDEDHFYNYLVDQAAGQSLWELIEEDIFVVTDAHRRVLFANVERAVQLLYDNKTADLLERCIDLWSFFTPLPAPETSRHVVDNHVRRLHPELDMERATVETLPNAKMAVARDPHGEHPFASWFALFSKSADQDYPRRLFPDFCQAVFGKATNLLRFLVQPLTPRFYAESREVRENLDDWCKFATDEEDFMTLFVLGINGYTQRHKDINDAQGGGNLCVPQLKVKVRYQPGAAAIIAGDVLDHLVLDYSGTRFFVIGTNHDSVKQRVYRKMGKLPPITRAEEDDDAVPAALAALDSESEDCDEYGHLYEDDPKAPPCLNWGDDNYDDSIIVTNTYLHGGYALHSSPDSEQASE